MLRLGLQFALALSIVATTFAADLPTGLGLRGEPVHPFEVSSGTKAVVLFFTAPDCPISNRYAPTMVRVAQQFGSKGVKSWLVYSDDLSDAATIKQHRIDYSLALPAAIDREFAIADFVGADVTPEVAVYVLSDEDRSPNLVYLGRIDDQYQGFGKFRPTASQHDLQDLLASIVAGEVPEFRKTKAVGCYIPRP